MIATGGTQTLAQITEFSQMDKENVREALLTLIHHNLVTFETKTRAIHIPSMSVSSSAASSSSSVLVEEQTVVKKKYLYKIDVEKVVERMRFARYVLQARSMFGHKVFFFFFFSFSFFFFLFFTPPFPFSFSKKKKPKPKPKPKPILIPPSTTGRISNGMCPSIRKSNC